MNHEVRPKTARKIHILQKNEYDTDNQIFLDEIKENITTHRDFYVLKSFYPAEDLRKIRKYLHNIGTNSLPKYETLINGCPDFHRIVNDDLRSSVKSVMHQYVFHSWNDNAFDFFNYFKKIFHLKNQLGGFDKDYCLNNTPDNDFVARVAFHHYVAGGGYLQCHADPVGSHQFVVPILQLSTKGEDFTSGGFYIINENNEKVFLDEHAEIGDLLLTHGEVKHGVDYVDSQKKIDWLSDAGRWMFLGAIVKTPKNHFTSNASTF
jgi:hypothetical protein